MAGHTYSKPGPLSKRQPPPANKGSEQLLEFGETVQLPGGVSTDRKFSGVYVPGAPTDRKGGLPGL